MDKPLPTYLRERLEYDKNKGMQKVVTDEQKCEDCDRTVVGRTLELRWRRPSRCPGHWARRCNICKMYANPESGEFEYDLKQLNSYFKL